eukprot:m.194833 g.194833  ORF g.194833 m.194833 type:complete len:63 (+) comp14889_c0_seq25:110-298(+)
MYNSEPLRLVPTATPDISNQQYTLSQHLVAAVIIFIDRVGSAISSYEIKRKERAKGQGEAEE